MQQLIEAISDWRFPSSVIALGPWIGHLIYRLTPLPPGAREHLQRMSRAGEAIEAAQRQGQSGMADAAAMVGLREGAAVFGLLRKQRRQMLIAGLLMAAAALAAVFLYTEIEKLPTWLFIVVMLLGAVRAWRSW
jgi:hypothetical protein